MALIKCPECGKENVSDSAESCPSCGYGIKQHFEKIKQKETEQKIQEQRIKSVSMPRRSDKGKAEAIIGFVGTIFFLIVLLANPSLAVVWVFAIIIFLGNGIIGLIEISKAEDEYQRKLTLYNMDKERYAKQEIARKDREKEEALKREQEAPKCPTCGSTDIEKIGIADRAISVGTVGLASNKINKSFKCKKCKYTW